MDWKNSEQYPDYTAGEAMARTMIRPSWDPGALDDDGCRLLVEAVVRQAVEDYTCALDQPASRPAAAARLKETAAFFRSEHFRRLTGLNGDTVLRLVRREVKRK